MDAVGRCPFASARSPLATATRLVAASGLQRQDRRRQGSPARRGVLVPVARWHFGRSERRDRLLLSAVIDESPNRLNGAV